MLPDPNPTIPGSHQGLGVESKQLYPRYSEAFKLLLGCGALSLFYPLPESEYRRMMGGGVGQWVEGLV